ncbi:K(+)/H(+) antiporter [Phlyctochytrium bullatum]|nr:K(+)/H(+) antiporter [Phlyctochytrium bullatum]
MHSKTQDSVIGELRRANAELNAEIAIRDEKIRDLTETTERQQAELLRKDEDLARLEDVERKFEQTSSTLQTVQMEEKLRIQEIQAKASDVVQKINSCLKRSHKAFGALIGLELDPQFFVRNIKRSALVSLSGIVLPFGAVFGAATLLHNSYASSENTYASFCVFVATAMSMTHFPAIARILTERKLLSTSVGQATLATGAVDDVITWTLLFYVVAFINNPTNPLVALYIFLVMAAYALFLWFLVRPYVMHWVQISSTSGSVSQILVFVVLAMALVSGFFTHALGGHALFGGFLIGIIVPHGHSFAINLVEKLEDMISIVFLPIYFAYAGFNVRLDMLNDAQAWGLVFLFVALSSVGVLMNTKGLLEFVILNIGVQSSVITPKIYTILVVSVLISNVLSLPLIAAVTSRTTSSKRHAQTSQTKALDGGDLAIKDKLLSSETTGEHELKLLCYLPGMPAVPAIMAFAELLKHEDNPSLTLVALRLIRLSDRYSTVMMATDADSSLRSDSVISIFRTFGHLNQIGVRSVLAISNIEEFPDQIVASAASNEANLVVIPWQHAADSSSLVDENHMHSLVDAVQRDSPCSVAVLIDRGFGVLRRLPSSPNENSSDLPSLSREARQRIFLPFVGGLDDNEALRLVSYLGNGASPHVQVTILKLFTSVGRDGRNAVLPSHSEISEEFFAKLRSALEERHSVEYSETKSSAPVSAIIAKAGEVANEKGDLIIMGSATYSNATLKLWADRETVASVFVVQGHPTRALL